MTERGCKGILAGMNYSDYLNLKSLLSTQKLKSEANGKPAHDEMLFIIVHQAYELWFKQILYELDSLCDLFKSEQVDEKNIGVAVHRLNRINLIQNLLLEQLPILETMTPLDFLEFRNLLVPASGFQSVQFRLIENKLGLRRPQRLKFEGQDYETLNPENEAKTLKASEEEVSLFELIEKWLERTPFLKFENFDFLKNYQQSVQKMLQKDKEIISQNPTLSSETRQQQLLSLEHTRQNFEALFDEKKHEVLIKKGERRISYRATLAALFIFLYRDQPILHLPFNFLTHLVDLDELLSTWRYRHALLAYRMIGTKIGTGGSSGYDYLKATIDKHKIFSDFTNCSTFLIPRSSLPPLPKELEKNLSFYFSASHD